MSIFLCTMHTLKAMCTHSMQRLTVTARCNKSDHAKLPGCSSQFYAICDAPKKWEALDVSTIWEDLATPYVHEVDDHRGYQQRLWLTVNIEMRKPDLQNPDLQMDCVIISIWCPYFTDHGQYCRHFMARDPLSIHLCPETYCLIADLEMSEDYNHGVKYHLA